MAPAQPANMRVTRQRAARERQQQQLLQQQQQQEQPSGGEPMAVEPEGFNLDPLSIRDPQLCHHYTKEIYSYLRSLEMEHRVSPHYMQVGTTTAPRARTTVARQPSPACLARPPPLARRPWPRA